MVTRNQNFDVVLERYREMHFLLVSVSFLKLHAVLGLLNDRTHRRNQSLAKHLSCSVLAFGCYFPYLRFEKILNTPPVPIEKQNSIKRVCVCGGGGGGTRGGGGGGFKEIQRVRRFWELTNLF